MPRRTRSRTSEAGGFEHLEPTGEPPSGRTGFHYAYDEASDRVILFGGQTGEANLDLDGYSARLEIRPDGSYSFEHYSAGASASCALVTAYDKSVGAAEFHDWRLFQFATCTNNVGRNT